MSNPALYELELELLEAAREYERAVTLRDAARDTVRKAMESNTCGSQIFAASLESSRRVEVARDRFGMIAIRWAAMERA